MTDKRPLMSAVWRLWRNRKKDGHMCGLREWDTTRRTYTGIRKTVTPDGVTVFLVEEGGFEPPKSVTTDLQSAPFGRSGTPPYEVVELVDGFEPPTC